MSNNTADSRSSKEQSDNVLSRLESLEERLEKPGYLLFVVTILLLLIIGWVNLVSHSGDGTRIFGVYSLRQFVAIVGWTVITIGWSALLLRPNDDRWLNWSLQLFRDRPVLVLALVPIYGFAFWHMFTYAKWLNFPVLQTTFIAIMVIFAAMLVNYKWTSDGPMLWQRIVVYTFGAFIAVEIVLQALAFFNVLPALNDVNDAYAPYDRIYYEGPNGFTNTTANEFGIYQPDYRLEEGTHRVLLLGDLSVQGLQVEMEENMGVLLDQQLTEAELFADGSEVMSMGYFDYGPGVYLSVGLFFYRETEVEPNEVVIFFDFLNDFQSLEEPNGYNVFQFVDENGEIAITDEQWPIRHDLAHEMLVGLEGYQPRRLLNSHYLTWQLGKSLLVDDTPPATNFIDAPANDLSLDNAFVFYDETNDGAMAIAFAQLEAFLANATEQGYQIRLVTVPTFSDEFFAQSGTEWTTQFGDADLFLPEQELEAWAAANGVSFLGMGQQMQAAGLSVADIDALYFDELGALTADGHAYFADAVFGCFYGGSQPAGCTTE